MLIRVALLWVVLQALHSCSPYTTSQWPSRGIAPEMIKNGLAALYAATESSNTKCYPLLDKLYFRAYEGTTWDGDSSSLSQPRLNLVDIKTGKINEHNGIGKRYLPIFFTYDYSQPIRLHTPYTDSLLLDNFNYPSFKSDYHRTAVYYSQFFKQDDGYVWIISCDEGPDFPENDLFIRFHKNGEIELATWGIDW